MSTNKIEAEILDLRAKLNHHNHLYYIVGEPVISDHEFDRMLDRLIALEEKHPEFEDPNSPSKRVGGNIIDAFETVRHTVPMLSVDKSYSNKDIEDWLVRIGKLLPDKSFRFYVDPKIDGVAVGLRYENGELVQGVTRGDGEQGDDITNNVRAIPSVPLRLNVDPEHPIPEVLEVRGEIFMTRVVFEKLNAQLASEGGVLHKNPRNLTAGTLKSLNNSAVVDRRLEFCMHGVGDIQGGAWAAHSDFVKSAAAWGIPQSALAEVHEEIEDVMQYLKNFEETRQKIGYDTDGVVIRVDNYENQENLGRTAKAPRWAIAYKYASEQAETTLHSVDFMMGKRGVITPRGNMNPVELGGSTVQHASLHNFDEVARKDIRVGDRVIIEKAGEIIPYVVCSLPEHRTGKEQPILPPPLCPSCGAATVKKEGEAILRCSNYTSCPGSLVKALRHFSGRSAMDIKGLGRKVIQQLVDLKHVTRFDDLYTLEEKTLSGLERMGTKSARNLVDAIEKSKSRGLGRLLNSVCIPHVGEAVAKLLAEVYGDIDALAAATLEQLALTDGIGEIVADGIVGWFEEPRNKELIKALKGHGVLMGVARPAASASTVNSTALKGLTVVVTGKLERFSRSEINAFVEAAGGKASGSISKKTSLLVYGAKAGSKLSKAQKLGVEAITEQDFYTRFGLGETAAQPEPAAPDVAPTPPPVVEATPPPVVEASPAAATEPEPEAPGAPTLSGLTIVVTGKLARGTRAQINALISSAGGKPSGSISKKTDLLVYGDKAGSKLSKAESLGVKTMTESDFYKQFGADPA